MSTVTKIEWADRSWSPILGCSRVSPGCDNCYAIRTVHRLSHNPHPKIGPLYQGLTVREADVTDWTGKIATVPGRLTDPFAWRKPQRVFVNSQSDLFHADIPDEFIAKVFAVMAATPRHTYQVLTKRHARMRALLNDPAFQRLVHATGHREKWGWPPRIEFPAMLRWPLLNLWLGVSAETQGWADIRIPALIDTPAAVRWVSVEPMLGPIDLGNVGGIDALCPDVDQYPGVKTMPHAGLSWIVVGAESGPGARALDLAWVDHLVGQCRDAGTASFVKQLPTGPGGRATQDLTTFPAHLRVREYPTTGRNN